MSRSSKKPSNLTEKTPGSQPCFQVVKAFYEESVLLIDWWLIEVESNSKGSRLGVAGRPSRGRQAIRDFISTAIIKRHDAVTLETEDGITVTITNGINMFRTLQNGFPREVCSHFLCGFPYDWKEFADKASIGKTGPAMTSIVNGFATSLDDLPVAHVRNILMLSSGDSARSLIEKCISSHLPRKQVDNVFKDLNCAETGSKRKRQEDDTIDNIRLVVGDLSDDPISKTQSASTYPKKASICQEDDTNGNSRLITDDLSDDAIPETQNASKIEEKSKAKGDDSLPMSPKEATNHKEDDTNDNSRLVSGDISDDTLKTQNACKVEEKIKEKNGSISSTDPKRPTTHKADDTNENSRLVSGLSDDGTPRTGYASVVEEKSNEKSDTLFSTNLVKETTPKVQVMPRKRTDKNSSGRVTRSMSRSNIL